MSLSDIVYRIVDAYDGPGMDGLAVERLQKALAQAWDEGRSQGRYEGRYRSSQTQPNPYEEEK